MFGKVNRMAGGFGLFLGASLGLAVLQGGVNIIADYEQANANLASVLGINIDQTEALQKSSQQLGATTAFTAAEVAGLQTEFAKLGFSQREILGATQGTLALAAATRTELPQAAAQVGAAIRAFGLDASEAGRVADVFAASTSKSALDMEKLNVSMSKVAPVAKQFGFSIEDSTALLGTLANAGFDASTMATSTRSILLNLADANGKLAKQLGKPARNFDEITKAMIELRKSGVSLEEMLDSTDKRSVAAFATLLEGSEKTRILQNALQNASGTAQEMAEKQLNTLRGSMTILNSTYEGFIISLNEGNGAFSTTLRSIIDVTAEVLSLASGMATAETELADAQKSTRRLAEITLRVLKIVKNLVIAYAALKVVIFATRTAYAAYSIAIGLANVLQGKSILAVSGNTIAMKAHLVATRAVTIATRAWNLVLMANPIGLIIAAVVALGIAIHQIIKNYDDWGAAMTLTMGPLGVLINMIMAFRRNWDAIKQSFETGGFQNGIKAIGLTIADSILMPLEQAAKWIEKITGLNLNSGSISLAREILARGIDITAAGGPDAAAVPSINPDAARDAAIVERSETVENQQATIVIKDDAGKASIDEGETSDGLDIRLDQTFAFSTEGN